ncbi:MAG: rhomboid family intramembrane serine protease [Chloroflexota bacterium]
MLPLYDTISSRRTPVMTWLLIGLNAAAFYYELRLGPQGVGRLFSTWGLIPARLLADPASSWMTVFTSMFLHGGWLHILSNMWVLFIFGDNVEDRLGHGRYLVFYLVSGVAAALLQSLFTAGSSGPVIGASGAIAGVLGAYLLFFPRARIVTLVFIFVFITTIEIPAVLFLGVWFILQLFSGAVALGEGVSSGVAWWAHIGGFAFGMAATLIFGVRRARRERWQ